jgi:hypothetical protein
MREFLGTVISEEEDSWLLRWTIAKQHPLAFIGCVAIFALTVLLIAIVAWVRHVWRFGTAMHVHQDSASLERHMEVAGPVFRGFVELVELSSIHIYGMPSERVLRQS